MRIYWDYPKSQHHPHDQKVLFVEFGGEDANVWNHSPYPFYSVEWVPTHDEILAILEALLRGPK